MIHFLIIILILLWKPAVESASVINKCTNENIGKCSSIE